MSERFVMVSAEAVALIEAHKALMKEGLHEDSVEQDNVMYDIEKLLQRLVLKEVMEYLNAK